MKKTLFNVFVTLSVALSIWFVASWIDIVADNCKPNPQHGKWNMFVLSVDAFEEEEEVGTVEVPTIYGNRVAWAEVESIDYEKSLVSFVDESGEIWTAEVGNAAEFDPNCFYEIHFDTQGTNDVYDDEILKVFCEV